MAELKIEDLAKRCEACKGTGDPTGMSPQVDFPKWGTAMMKACSACGGTGGVLTPAGQILRDFILWVQRS